mgnify:CR=1 FL=1
MTKVKICGITNEEDAQVAAELGASAIGFIFAESKRKVTPEQAARISRNLPPFIFRVGVFVNADPRETKDIYDYVGLDLIQLHGEEEPFWADVFPHRIIKTIFKEIPDGWVGKARAFLIDAVVAGQRGGTGVCADWSQAAYYARQYPLILAGGLHPGNVSEAIRKVKPVMVDVSSGVEIMPGKKDRKKLADFFKAVREGEQR